MVILYIVSSNGERSLLVVSGSNNLIDCPLHSQSKLTTSQPKYMLLCYCDRTTGTKLADLTDLMEKFAHASPLCTF